MQKYLSLTHRVFLESKLVSWICCDNMNAKSIYAADKHRFEVALIYIDMDQLLQQNIHFSRASGYKNLGAGAL